ncbi:MAG: hypothetical protein EBR89_06510 [Betaproteobacteria bacterium]|nr:hypothetical protein [Betaproteobacteria bacterium]
MKNKTLAVWLTFLTGPLGLHRLYLYGRYGLASWLTLVPLILGSYGVLRARHISLDDQLSWLLIPLLGLTISGYALRAIVYGLQAASAWNARFNPEQDPESPAGQTNGLTVFGLGASLLVGTGVLMATIAFSLQRIFEFSA